MANPELAAFMAEMAAAGNAAAAEQPARALENVSENPATNNPPPS